MPPNTLPPIDSLIEQVQSVCQPAEGSDDRLDKHCLMSVSSGQEPARIACQRVSRKEQWAAMRWQRQHAPRKSMSRCGCSVANRSNGDVVYLDKTKGKPAQYNNVGRCKSAWCVHCSTAFRSEKTQKIKLGIDSSIKNRFKVYFATFTIPKAFGMASDKFDALNGVIRKLFNLLRGKCNRASVRLWSVKSLDITISDRARNPLHLHTHAVIITDRELDDIREYVWKVYSREMNRLGADVSELAFDFQAVSDEEAKNRLSSYLLKDWNHSLEHEITSLNKRGSKGSKGWFEWLRSLVKRCNERQLAIYKDFLIHAKGRRTIDFSRNFDELIALSEQEEEELSETETGDSESYTWSIGGSLWKAIIETRTEEKILYVIDSFIDRGEREQDFLFITSLISSSEDKLYFSDDLNKEYVAKLIRWVYNYNEPQKEN